MHQTLVEYLLNAAWQVPLVATGAVIVSRLGGLAPGGRNLIWLAFLAVAVISPALPIGLPSPDVEASVRAVPPTAQPVDAAASELGPVVHERVSAWRLLRIGLDQKSGALIKLAFATAVGVGLVRLTLSGLAVRRLAESVDTVLSAPVAGVLQQFMRARGRGTPPVRQCAGVSSPVVIGMLNPVILVPDRFADLPQDDQQAALLHECAHVVRGDFAINLVCELITVPVGWHPAVYPLKAGVRRSRELACDAMAASAMASEETYARRLLSLARSLGGAETCGPSLALVGLFGKSSLEERLMHLMTPKGAVGPTVRVARLAAAASATVLALTPVMLFRVSPADAQTPPPLPPAPAAAAMSATPAVEATPPTPASTVRGRSRVDNRAHRRAKGQQPSFRESVTEDHGQRTIKGVLIGPDGKTVSVFSGESIDRIEDQQRRLEESMRRAVDRSFAAQRLVNSPEFQRRLTELAARQTDLAAVDREKMQKQMELATAALKNARVQEAIAQAQARIASAAVRESLDQAEKIRHEMEQSARDAARSN